MHDPQCPAVVQFAQLNLVFFPTATSDGMGIGQNIQGRGETAFGQPFCAQHAPAVNAPGSRRLPRAYRGQSCRGRMGTSASGRAMKRRNSHG